MNWLVHDQLILNEIDFRPDILDLRNNSFQDCVFQALKRRGTSRLSLCLDVLELVVWKVVIGMWAFDLYFWGGTLTVLYVTSWQSVGCQHTFPKLVAYLLVMLLKSRQKQSAGWLSYRTHIGGYAVYQGLRQKQFLLDIWALPHCQRECPTSRCHWLTMLHQ